MSLTLFLSYCQFTPSCLREEPRLFPLDLSKSSPPASINPFTLYLYHSATKHNHLIATHPPPEIQPNQRCRLTDSPTKRGLISYVGAIPSLPGPPGAPWIGITLDEPVGKNDGSVASGERYFTCGRNRGVFVRPERVEVGDFAELGLDDDDEGEGSEMEEI